MDSAPEVDASGVVRRPPFGSNPLVGERGSDTQRKILSAALHVFGEVGFNEARVELITRRAGCSRPAFYQYFSSKDDVFWRLAGELGRQMVELGDQLGPVTADADGVEALAGWIRRFTALYDSYSPVFSAFQAASRGHQTLAAGASTISDRLGEALLRGFGVSSRRARSRALAAALVAVLVRCSFYRATMRGLVERGPLVDGLAQILHRLFVGPVDGVNMVRADASPRSRRPGSDAVAPVIEPSRAMRPRGEKTRQRLLDAGAKVLPARGYHDARVDDIVQLAGVSHGSFYRYFKNKDELFRVLADQASTRMIELLDGFPWHADATDLHTWLEDWFVTYESNGGVISTWQEMQHAEADLVSFGQQVAAVVLARLMAKLDARGFGDPLVDALALLALIERMPYSVHTLGFTKPADAIDAMVTIVRRGFMALPE